MTSKRRVWADNERTARTVSSRLVANHQRGYSDRGETGGGGCAGLGLACVGLGPHKRNEAAVWHMREIIRGNTRNQERRAAHRGSDLSLRYFSYFRLGSWRCGPDSRDVLVLAAAKSIPAGTLPRPVQPMGRFSPICSGLGPTPFHAFRPAFPAFPAFPACLPCLPSLRVCSRPVQNDACSGGACWSADASMAPHPGAQMYSTTNNWGGRNHDVATQVMMCGGGRVELSWREKKRSSGRTIEKKEMTSQLKKRTNLTSSAINWGNKRRSWPYCKLVGWCCDVGVTA